MSELLILLPPWIFALLVTWLGQWGERFLIKTGRTAELATSASGTFAIIASSLVFLSILPTFALTIFQPMLPFVGAQAGLALGVAAFLFGLLPARLCDVRQQGWDRTIWMMLIDFVRVVGALTMVGWLLLL